ncbi:MAG: cation-translocating P-type ATPase, partial [Oscillospiraceae bacterium]
NSTADVQFENDLVTFIGNPTECALLAAAKKAGYNYKTVRASVEKHLHIYPFSSETKNMTSVVKLNGKCTVYTKGSPEKIIDMCAMNATEYKKIQDEIIAYQEKACRVIAFAHREIEEDFDFKRDRNHVESELIYDGFVAITDPLRGDVYDAVMKCRNAGIDLKMLTGDNIVTAIAIAEELGILDKDHIAIEAKDLESLSEKDFLKILPKIRVIARSTPIIKMRVVNGLKYMGNVVAVTGDGINDAPAIKNADVGIAMGITGTEVSKEASDIVLLDDSFSTIVKAVHWGRGIYENFQRFIQFQLTVNLASVLFVLTAVLIGAAAPFTALELLWINLIMDGPPALTLGLEPIRSDMMKRLPTPRGKSIVTGSMLGRIVFNGIFMAVIMLFQMNGKLIQGTPEQMNTIIFTMFVLFQLFNAFNSRELSNESIFKNIMRNKAMLLVVAGTFLLQFIITQFGGFVFGTVPLTFDLWIKVIAVAFSIIIVSEIFKFCVRIFENSREKVIPFGK